MKSKSLILGIVLILLTSSVIISCKKMDTGESQIQTKHIDVEVDNQNCSCECTPK